MSSNTINWRPNKMIRQLPWNLDSQATVGFLLILATFSLVGWLYLSQASAVTATSYRIDELRLELDQLGNQNAALSLEIAKLQAISHVERRAQDLGLGPTTNIRYLSVSNYPATTEAALPSYAPLNSGLQTAKLETQLEGPGWWANTLDTVTIWLANE